MERTGRSLLMFLYASMFLIAFSVGLYNPLVPLYAQSFGASYFDLGIIGMAFSFPYLVLPMFVGALSDRFGRRCFFLMGVSCCAVSAVLFTLASNVSHIIAVRLFGGVAYAFMWPTVEALVADVTTVEERTKAMGRYGFSWALGFLVGPFVGGLLLEKLGFKILFAAALIIGLAAVITAFRGILTHNVKLENPAIATTREITSMTGLLPLYPVIVVYSITIGLIFSIFPAYASSFGVSSLQIGILFAILGVARTVTFLRSEAVSKIGVRQSISVALTIQAVSLIGIAYLKGFTHLMVLMALIGFAIGIFSPMTLSIASKISPKGRVGATIGFLEAFFGIGVTFGPFIGGVAAESLGPASPYIIVAFLSGLTLLPIIIWKRRLDI